MHHYNGDALIFRLAYGIKSLHVCGWSYEWVFITYWTPLVLPLEMSNYETCAILHRFHICAFPAIIALKRTTQIADIILKKFKNHHQHHIRANINKQQKKNYFPAATFVVCR